MTSRTFWNDSLHAIWLLTSGAVATVFYPVKTLIDLILMNNVCDSVNQLPLIH